MIPGTFWSHHVQETLTLAYFSDQTNLLYSIKNQKAKNCKTRSTNFNYLAFFKGYMTVMWTMQIESSTLVNSLCYSLVHICNLVWYLHIRITSKNVTFWIIIIIWHYNPLWGFAFSTNSLQVLLSLAASFQFLAFSFFLDLPWHLLAIVVLVYLLLWFP